MAYTPNYPMVTIQYFWFSTRKPFGIKRVYIEPLPITSFLQTGFSREKRAKCWTNV